METADARRESAPYGRACKNCVRAKCRCLVRDAGTCERCQRLGKECIPSTTLRAKGAKRNGALRTSALEDKLNDIVSLLQSQTNTQHGRSTDAILTPGSTVSPSGSVEVPEDQDLTEEELCAFREKYLPEFPMVNIPSDYTAAEAQKQKPIFSLAIKALTTRVASKQVILGKKLRETLTQKILIEGERSLPLLLSLLASITWSLSFTHGKPFLGAMIGLARPLVSDLKLDRGPNVAGCPGHNPPHLVDNQGEDNITQTNAGRRAYIACFALSVVISTTMKYDAMRWSSQLESACSILAAHNEVDGDRVLVALARLAKVALDAGDIYREVSDNPDTTIHPAFSIAPLKCSLNQTKEMLTSEQLQHSTVITYLYTAEVAIYELALLRPQTLIMRYCDQNLKRIEYLTGLLQTCKACTEHFLAFDLSLLTAPPMIMFGYSVKLSYCLLTLQMPGWDTAMARMTLDPGTCFERAIERCEQTNMALRLETGEDSIFRQAADTMRATAPQWKVPVGNHDPSLGLESLTPAVDFSLLDMPSLELAEDFWLNSVSF